MRSSVTPVVARSLGAQLRVGGAGGMDDERLGVADVGEPGEELHLVDDGLARVQPALHAEGQDAAETRAGPEVALGRAVAFMVLETGIVHPSDLGMILQPPGQRQGIAAMGFEPQGQRLQSLDAAGRH